MTIGHNNPPSDAELLREKLELNHQQEIADALKILKLTIADGPCDEQRAGRITGLLGTIANVSKALESARVVEKEPFLTQGRVVDAFFKDYLTRLEAVRAAAQKPLTAYLRKKADDERAARQAEANRLREEQEAEQKKADDLRELNRPAEAMATEMGAARMDQDIARADKKAEAKGASIAQVRTGDTSASLRSRWVGEITNRSELDIERLRTYIPTEALQRALNQFVADGGRELKGATITEQHTAAVR